MECEDEAVYIVVVSYISIYNIYLPFLYGSLTSYHLFWFLMYPASGSHVLMKCKELVFLLTSIIRDMTMKQEAELTFCKKSSALIHL